MFACFFFSKVSRGYLQVQDTDSGNIAPRHGKITIWNNNPEERQKREITPAGWSLQMYTGAENGVGRLLNVRDLVD
jgi:hypothetical protein